MSDVPVPTRSLHRRPDLPSLTALRAGAALAVFLYHLNRWQVTDVLPFGLGYAGVTFFFLLSGFILTWSHVPEQRVADFYVRRFARVYPTHLLLWLLVVLVPVAAAAPTRWNGALESLLLLQPWDTRNVFAANGVAWSLGCEAVFYALFPLLLPLVARLRLRTAVVAAVVLHVVAGGATVLAVRAGAADGVLTALFTQPLLNLPTFLIGVVLARAVIAGGRPRARWLLPAAAYAALGLLVARDRPAADVWCVPLVAVAIALLAGLDLGGAPSVLHRRGLLAAGRISFAFYLVHELVIVNAARLLGPGPVTAVVALAVAAALAWVLHSAIEVPANRAVLAVWRRIPPGAATRRSADQSATLR